MSMWLERVCALARENGVAARAVIIEAEGPTPREVGSALLVAGGRVEGRIGRGQLETDVVEEARRLCQMRVGAGGQRWTRVVSRFETGAVLGEPTGGVISVLIEVLTAEEGEWLSTGATIVARPLQSGRAPVLFDHDGVDSGGVCVEVGACVQRMQGHRGTRLELVDARTDGMWLVERTGSVRLPFNVYGTGLIARALVGVLAGLPFDVTWIDGEPAHFPDMPLGDQVRRVADRDPARLAGEAAAGTYHAVMTQSHEVDYAICHRVLERNAFGYLGVIGANVKRQRMEQRLIAEGIDAEAIARMACPIGLSGIRSKVPAVIAVSIAAQVLQTAQVEGAPIGSKR